MERYDVAVIGAGLAGLHSAFELARLRLRVALIERQRVPGERVATTGIFVRKTLDDFSIPAHCLGPWVGSIAVHSPNGRTLELVAKQPEFRVGRMRPLYDYLLLRCTASGVTWMPQTTFVSLGRDRGDAVLLVRRGSRTETVRTRFVIGADGTHSRVARALGLSVNR